MKRNFNCSLESNKRVKVESSPPVLVSKRENYIKWEEFFMLSARLTSERSKDPCKQVGAVIVNKDNRIIGSGYNGFPNKISDDSLSWGKRSTNELENKRLFVVHAEMNAILNCNIQSCKDCTIYCTLLCCSVCMQAIIQSGINKIVFSEIPDMEKDTYKASLIMARLANIELVQYEGKKEFLIII
jgi:dCMP deaminase